MARITTEDCLDKVDNLFELILVAGHRARQISKKSPITVVRENDKDVIVALREIAEGTISAEDIKEDLIQSMQLYADVDESEPAEVPVLSVNSQCSDDLEDHIEFDRLSEEELLNGLKGLPPPTSYDSSSYSE